MADVTSIYGNPIKDAVARADISTLQTDVQDVKDGLNADTAFIVGTAKTGGDFVINLLPGMRMNVSATIYAADGNSVAWAKVYKGMEIYFYAISGNVATPAQCRYGFYETEPRSGSTTTEYATGFYAKVTKDCYIAFWRQNITNYSAKSFNNTSIEDKTNYLSAEVHGTSGILTLDMMDGTAINPSTGQYYANADWTAGTTLAKRGTRLLFFADGVYSSCAYIIFSSAIDNAASYIYGSGYGVTIPDDKDYNIMISIHSSAVTQFTIGYFAPGIGENYIKDYFTGNSMIDVNHRGFSQYYPENSLPAFEMSHDYGYKFVECDIQKCLDGYVVMHDANTSSVTGVSGDITSMTVAQIQAIPMNITGRYSALNVKIPTLEQALECFRKVDVIPLIELKKETIDLTDIPIILDILEKWGGKYVITSLEHGLRNDGNTHKLLLEAVREYSDRIPINVLFWESLTIETAFEAYNTFGINTSLQVYEATNPTSDLVDFVHGLGLLIGAFTPSTYQRYNDMMVLGMDFCTTNYLMNNHIFPAETHLHKISEQTFTSKSFEIPNTDGSWDVLWVRGFLKSNSDVIIDYNSQYYNTYAFDSNGEYQYVNWQFWTRGTNTPTITIKTTNGTDTISTTWLNVLTMKGIR